MANELPTNYPFWVTPDLSGVIFFDKTITITKGGQKMTLTYQEFIEAAIRAQRVYEANFLG